MDEHRHVRRVTATFHTSRSAGKHAAERTGRYSPDSLLLDNQPGSIAPIRRPRPDIAACARPSLANLPSTPLQPWRLPHQIISHIYRPSHTLEAWTASPYIWPHAHVISRFPRFGCGPCALRSKAPRQRPHIILRKNQPASGLTQLRSNNRSGSQVESRSRPQACAAPHLHRPSRTIRLFEEEAAHHGESAIFRPRARPSPTRTHDESHHKRDATPLSLPTMTITTAHHLPRVIPGQARPGQALQTQAARRWGFITMPNSC